MSSHKLNDLSRAVIPFSKIVGSPKPVDIYSGNEHIPFRERDPEYKVILKQEFANYFNVEFKVFKSVTRFPSF
jgi:hypothetical protein